MRDTRTEYQRNRGRINRETGGQGQRHEVRHIGDRGPMGP